MSKIITHHLTIKYKSGYTVKYTDVTRFEVVTDYNDIKLLAITGKNTYNNSEIHDKHRISRLAPTTINWNNDEH